MEPTLSECKSVGEATTTPCADDDSFAGVSLLNAHGNATAAQLLFDTAVLPYIAELCQRFAAFLQIDPALLANRVEAKVRMGTVLGKPTLVHRTSELRNGCRVMVDRDILAFALGRASPVSALKAYLGNLTRMRAATLARREKAGRRAAFQFRSRTSETSDPIQEFAMLEDLKSVLERIPALKKEVVVEYFFIGGTQIDVARRLGITRDEFQGRLAQALRLLRDRFG